jgi:photosystem II stability/assembly factor-like uncharacterized protein
MKKIALPLLVLLLIDPSFSQWSQISTVNTTQLNAVKFFNEWTGITAGVGGIWRSTNSGVNWTQVLAEVNMNSVSFFDDNNGYAAGDSGKIYRTLNNGLTWEQQGSGLTTYNLYSAFFSSSVRFHAVGSGGVILRTINGGSSWSSQYLGGGQDFYSVIMNFDGTGYVIGSQNNEIGYNTVNGGTNWIGMSGINGYGCYDITFVNNAQNVITVGSNGRIRKSTNGGFNWTYPQSNYNVNLNAVIFINSTLGYIAGNFGIIFKTTDEGVTWSYLSVGYANNLRDINFINEQTGWTVGQNGIVLRTGIPVNIIKNGNEIPQIIKLYQNYPNPFNSETKITFEVNKNKIHTVLTIYDMLGKKIQSLVNDDLINGKYEIIWNANNYTSGLYFAKINTPDLSIWIKMIVLK